MQAICKLDEALQVAGISTHHQAEAALRLAAEITAAGSSAAAVGQQAAGSCGASRPADAGQPLPPPQQQLQQPQQQPAASSSGTIAKPLRWACDIGAAPGSWTSLLAAQCSGGVVAIDPADLDPAVLGLPNVHHLRMKAQEAVQPTMQLIGAQQLDLLTCDMNAHPHDMKGVVAPMLPLLRPGGCAGGGWGARVGITCSACAAHARGHVPGTGGVAGGRAYPPLAMALHHRVPPPACLLGPPPHPGST